MKSLQYTFLALLILFSPGTSGDIIITGPSTASIKVRINNLNDFPDVAVIGVSECFALFDPYKAYRIEPGYFLKVNKSCPLSLYTLPAGKLKTLDLEKIDWENDINVKKLNLTVKATSFNSSAYRELIIDFNLARHNDTTLYLYKSKMTYKYRTNAPDNVQFFPDDADPFKPISVTTKNAI